jgi:hypothetical protein
MLDIYDVVRIVIVSFLFIAFLLSIVAVYLIPKRLQQCPAADNAKPKTAADLLYAGYFYPFTRDELTLVSLLGSFAVMAFMLSFLVFINNFRITSILFAIPLLVISSIALSTVANLSKDASSEVRSQYDPNTSISVPLLYVAMSIAIVACVLTLYYYGRHFVKDMRHII